MDNKFTLETRIFGGQQVIKRSAPYAGYIEFIANKTCTNDCGGFILISKWILTAAHCVK